MKRKEFVCNNLYIVFLYYLISWNALYTIEFYSLSYYKIKASRILIFSTELSLHKFQQFISFLNFEYLSCSHLSIRLIKVRIFARGFYRVAGPRFFRGSNIFHRLPWLFPPSSYFPSSQSLLRWYTTIACLFKRLTYKRYSAGEKRDASLSLSLSGQFFLRKRGRPGKAETAAR